MNLLDFSSRYIKCLFVLVLFLGMDFRASAQDPLRFQQEVDQVGKRYADIPLEQDLILFTGSSSIKMWKDLSDYFPGHQIINTGFGGSQTSDLLYYVDELVLHYKPKKIFIYEGDNDLFSGESTAEILEDMHKLVEEIKSQLPDSEIFLISAKPSISRWHLKEQYRNLNSQLKQYSQTHENVKYVDIWNTMLGEGKPKADIFLEDDLHMNKAGYDLWAEVIGRYID